MKMPSFASRLGLYALQARAQIASGRLGMVRHPGSGRLRAS